MPRSQFAADAIPLLYDLLLAGHGRGIESLFLTVLTAAEGSDREIYASYVKRLPALQISADGDEPEMFCDLSMSGKALFSRMSRSDLGDVFQALARDPMIQIGAYARGATPPPPAETEQMMLGQPLTKQDGGGYSSCVIGFTLGGMGFGAVAGGIAGGLGGSALGPWGTAAGFSAGFSTGGLAGGAAGKHIGQVLCRWKYGKPQETLEVAPALLPVDVGWLGDESSATDLLQFMLQPDPKWRPWPPMRPWPPNIWRPQPPIPSPPFPPESGSPKEVAEIISRDLISRLLSANPNMLIEQLGPDRVLVHDFATSRFKEGALL
jgi:hypothetical protein